MNTGEGWVIAQMKMGVLKSYEEQYLVRPKSKYPSILPLVGSHNGCLTHSGTWLRNSAMCPCPSGISTLVSIKI